MHHMNSVVIFPIVYMRGLYLHFGRNLSYANENVHVCRRSNCKSIITLLLLLLLYRSIWFRMEFGLMLVQPISPNACYHHHHRRGYIVAIRHIQTHVRIHIRSTAARKNMNAWTILGGDANKHAYILHILSGTIYIICIRSNECKCHWPRDQSLPSYANSKKYMFYAFLMHLWYIFHL